MMAILYIMAAGYSAACETSEGKCDNPSSMIGLELTPIILQSGVGLHFSHAIGGKWTISAGAGINVRNIAKGLSETEKSHYKEFSDMDVRPEGLDASWGECSVQYWLGKCYKGAFLSVGIRHGTECGLGFMAEGGFRIRIAKGLGLSLSARCIMPENKNYNIAENIKIGINYAF